MESTTITIKNYKCPSWNELYSQKHWTKRKEMADLAHLLVYTACNQQKVKPITSYPVHITVTAYRKREIDASNCNAKLLEDGLVHAGILKDDSPKYVDSMTTRCVKSDQEYVEIEIQSNVSI